MATMEERMVAVEVRTRTLEGRMSEKSQMVAAADLDIKTQIASVDARMERRFDALDRKFLWAIAVQFTTLLAIIAGAVGIITKFL